MATENNPPNVSASTTLASASTALASAMSQMMLDPDFADLNVKCGDKEWKLHTALLAARSPFFKAAISTNMKEKRNMEIDIKDMDPEAMEQVVNFMYGISVDKGPVKDLIEAAERFQMKDLMDNVLEFAMKKLSLDTVVEVGRVAELYNIELLLEECAQFVAKNDVEVNEDMPSKLATKVVQILKEDLKVANHNLELSEADLVKNKKSADYYKKNADYYKEELEACFDCGSCGLCRVRGRNEFHLGGMRHQKKKANYALKVSEARQTMEVEISSKPDLLKEMNWDRETSTKFNVTIRYNMTQELLELLAWSNLGRQMEKLDIHPEYAEGVAVLDFSEVAFLNLKRLTIRNHSMKAVHFTKEKTPILESLAIESIQPEVETFHLDLPELRFMSVRFLAVMDPTGFGESLSRSPKLEDFISYKLWGLHVPRRKTHKLVLPNCERLFLYRSDDLNYLKIWAPKLEDFNLRACDSLEEVNILDQKPNGYSGPEYAFTGTPSQYEVNLINTEYPEKPRGNVTTHQRCSNIIQENEELQFF